MVLDQGFLLVIQLHSHSLKKKKNKSKAKSPQPPLRKGGEIKVKSGIPPACPAGGPAPFEKGSENKNKIKSETNLLCPIWERGGNRNIPLRKGVKISGIL